MSDERELRKHAILNWTIIIAVPTISLAGLIICWGLVGGR